MSCTVKSLIIENEPAAVLNFLSGSQWLQLSSILRHLMIFSVLNSRHSRHSRHLRCRNAEITAFSASRHSRHCGTPRKPRFLFSNESFLFDLRNLGPRRVVCRGLSENPDPWPSDSQIILGKLLSVWSASRRNPRSNLKSRRNLAQI